MAGLALCVRLARGGLREHHPTRAVEVAGDRVQHVDEPARERPELLRAGPDPAVNACALRAGELARDPADVVGGDAARLGCPLSVEWRHELARELDAIDVLGRVADVGEA